MSEQGKANYEAVAARIGSDDDYYEKLSPSIRAAYDAGADAVELWLSQAPVDEDMPGNEPDGLVNEILLNAPERYDGDEAAESIAVRYVRDLEKIAKGATTLRTACAGLERICMGTADEADSSSIAEQALFAAIGHMPVSAIGTEPQPDHRALLGRAVRELADSGLPSQNALGAELARDGGIEP